MRSGECAIPFYVRWTNTREDTHSLCVVPKLICASPSLQAEIGSLQQLVLTKNVEIESLHTQLLTRPSSSAENSEKGKHAPPTSLPTVRELQDRWHCGRPVGAFVKASLAISELRQEECKQQTILKITVKTQGPCLLFILQLFNFSRHVCLWSYPLLFPASKGRITYCFPKWLDAQSPLSASPFPLSGIPQA